MARSNESSEVVRSEVEQAVGFPMEDVVTTVIRSQRISNTKFRKLSAETREYLNEQAKRIARNKAPVTPERFFRERSLEVPDLPEVPETSQRRDGATHHDIYKALLSCSEIIPSSDELIKKYKLSKHQAVALRRNCLAVLRALSDTGMFEHPALKTTKEFQALWRRKRKKV